MRRLVVKDDNGIQFNLGDSDDQCITFGWSELENYDSDTSWQELLSGIQVSGFLEAVLYSSESVSKTVAHLFTAYLKQMELDLVAHHQAWVSNGMDVAVSCNKLRCLKRLLAGVNTAAGNRVVLKECNFNDKTVLRQYSQLLKRVGADLGEGWYLRSRTKQAMSLLGGLFSAGKNLILERRLAVTPERLNTIISSVLALLDTDRLDQSIKEQAGALQLQRHEAGLRLNLVCSGESVPFAYYNQANEVTVVTQLELISWQRLEAVKRFYDNRQNKENQSQRELSLLPVKMMEQYRQLRSRIRASGSIEQQSGFVIQQLFDYSYSLDTVAQRICRPQQRAVGLSFAAVVSHNRQATISDEWVQKLPGMRYVVEDDFVNSCSEQKIPGCC